MEHDPDSPAAQTARPAASLEAELDPGLEASLVPATHAAQALVPHGSAPPPADESAEESADESVLSGHDFDPSDYKWLPVLRRPRSDGWTPQRQRDFIAALADMGCVAEAARTVHMTPVSCYRLRRSPGGENFAAAWEVATQHAARKLVDLAFDRAIHGSEEPVFNKDGYRVGRRMRQNDRLLMFLLRAYMPERFRHAHRDGRFADERLPPSPPPLEDALRLLEPPAPPEPHKLLDPDELEDALFIADVGTGELPHRHRGRGNAEPPTPSPLGPEFERELEAAKREAAGLPPLPDGDEAEEDWHGPFLA